VAPDSARAGRRDCQGMPAFEDGVLRSVHALTRIPQNQNRTARCPRYRAVES
jgi:hypothetical protein